MEEYSVDAEELFSGENSLFILGNGFDLDLGLKTSYQDFFSSEEWDNLRKEIVSDEGLIAYIYANIKGKASGKKWYDLESFLATYGESYAEAGYNEGGSEKEEYDALVRHLSAYLSSIDFDYIDSDSNASRLLKSLMNSILPGKIYTFNYTDLNKICEKLGIRKMHQVHVHGSLKRNNIILGVGDYANLKPSRDYWYKTSNEKYIGTNLVDDLLRYDNIVFFGLSLSKVDYPYFEDFFRKVANRDYTGPKKYIRIITKDNDSRNQILINLRDINHGMIKLRNNADFDILRTGNDNDDLKFKHLYGHLCPETDIDM